MILCYTHYNSLQQIIDDQTQIKKLRAEIASLKAASGVPIITVHPATASIVEVDLERQKVVMFLCEIKLQLIVFKHMQLFYIFLFTVRGG